MNQTEVICCECHLRKPYCHSLRIGAMKYICMLCHAEKFPASHVATYGVDKWVRYVELQRKLKAQEKAA